MDAGPDEPRPEAAPAGAVGPEGRRRGRRFGVAALVVLGLAGWAATCAVTLAQARRDALAGIDAVERAEELTSPSELVDGTALAPLRQAGDAFRRARRGLDNPAVLPLRVLPVVGRQVRSARALAGAADDIAAIGTQAVEEAQEALAQPRDTGPERVALLRRLGTAAARFERRLAAVDLGPGRALVDPLAERRAELVERLGEVRDAMGRGAVVATGLADLLAGPRTYLVIGANNAEMRAGSGMFLSIGLLTFADGTLSLGGFRPAPELLLAPDEAPPIADADLAARWGWMEPNREWRNLAASPRFAANAELAAAMWRAREGEEVEGVVMVDPVALRGLLTSTGPVAAGDVTVSADDVLSLLLHDQYAGIDEGGDEAQAARREMLGLIAAATLDAVQSQEGDVGALATAFGEMAAGRHLLAWSRHPGDHAMWEAAGVTGALTERSLSVAVLNRGGNKLDPFLDVDAALDVETSAGGGGHAVELGVTMRNTVPEGENRYVAGGGHRGLEDLPPGAYRGLVSVNLPAFATDVQVEGDPALAAAGPDGPTTVVAWEIRVDRGQTVTAVVRFRLPSELRRLTVEPSGRFPPVAWSAEGRSWESGPRRDVAW